MSVAPTPAAVAPDPADFGAVERVRLTPTQRIGGQRLANAWSTVPQVTHHLVADAGPLTAFRASLPAEERPSVLSLIVKAVADALLLTPRFCASLDPGGQDLVLKKYVHIGVAIDTPRGLLVGVVRDCDRKAALEIGAEIADLAGRARARGLPPQDMMGGCFTVSSLGGLAGEWFTPIVNPPEVGILGVSPLAERAVRNADGGLAWQTVLPLSLSYDHRVINGVEAAAFVATIARGLPTG